MVDVQITRTPSLQRSVSGRCGSRGASPGSPPPVNSARPAPIDLPESLDENVREAVRQLAEAVAARDTFIAVAAHELRNPMMPILGQIDLLRSGIRLGKVSLDQVDQRLERIQRTVQQYMKRAVVLLEVSRINSGSFRLDPCPCDLASLLRQIAEEFTATAAHSGVALTVDAPENLQGLWDRLAVEQVVDNLLSNAIKYAGRAPVELRLVEEERRVQIHVRDHGKAYPASTAPASSNASSAPSAMRLIEAALACGLWVVGQLVAAMRGSIDIEDAPRGRCIVRR